MSQAAQLFLAGRIAQLFLWIAGALASYGVSVTSTDQFQAVSSTLAAILFTLGGVAITELKQKWLLWTAPPGKKIVDSNPLKPTL